MLNYLESTHYSKWKYFNWAKFISFVFLASIIHLLLLMIGFRRLTTLLSKVFKFKNEKYYLDSKKEIRVLKRKINLYAKRVRESKFLLPNCLSTSILIWLILKQQGLDVCIAIGTKKEQNRFKAHAWVEYDNFPITDNVRTTKEYNSFNHKFLNF